MKKESYKFKEFIDFSIKIGDLVRLVDGSGLSCEFIDYPIIVNSYHILNTTNTIEKLTGVVVNVNQKYVTLNSTADTCYLQDIQISINGVLFRTASRFVKNVNQ